MADKVDVDATLAKAKEATLAAYAKADAEGLFSHFNDFNAELVQPWSYVMNDPQLQQAPTCQDKARYLWDMTKVELMSTASLRTLISDPPTDEAAFTKLMEASKTRFKCYNAIAFWLGFFEAVIYGIFGHHGWFSFLFNGLLAWLFAYVLYWSVCCNGKPKYMFWALIGTLFYTAFNVYMGWSVLKFILPAVLYFLKAVCTALLAVYGFILYMAANSGGSLIPADAFML